MTPRGNPMVRARVSPVIAYATVVQLADMAVLKVPRERSGANNADANSPMALIPPEWKRPAFQSKLNRLHAKASSSMKVRTRRLSRSLGFCAEPFEIIEIMEHFLGHLVAR